MKQTQACTFMAMPSLRERQLMWNARNSEHQLQAPGPSTYFGRRCGLDFEALFARTVTKLVMARARFFQHRQKDSPCSFVDVPIGVGNIAAGKDGLFRQLLQLDWRCHGID